MEANTAIAQVDGVIREFFSLGEEPVYVIEAKMYLPANKYSEGVFRVQVSKPVNLGRDVSIMEHGIFTFESNCELKVGKLLEIFILPS